MASPFDELADDPNAPLSPLMEPFANIARGIFQRPPAVPGQGATEADIDKYAEQVAMRGGPGLTGNFPGVSPGILRYQKSMHPALQQTLSQLDEMFPPRSGTGDLKLSDILKRAKTEVNVRDVADPGTQRFLQQTYPNYTSQSPENLTRPVQFSDVQGEPGVSDPRWLPPSMRTPPNRVEVLADAADRSSGRYRGTAVGGLRHELTHGISSLTGTHGHAPPYVEIAPEMQAFLTQQKYPTDQFPNEAYAHWGSQDKSRLGYNAPMTPGQTQVAKDWVRQKLNKVPLLEGGQSVYEELPYKAPDPMKFRSYPQKPTAQSEALPTHWQSLNDLGQDVPGWMENPEQMQGFAEKLKGLQESTSAMRKTNTEQMYPQLNQLLGGD